MASAGAVIVLVILCWWRRRVARRVQRVECRERKRDKAERANRGIKQGKRWLVVCEPMPRAKDGQRSEVSWHDAASRFFSFGGRAGGAFPI